MAPKLVTYSKKDHIAWITLNRPENGNSINLAMAQEVAEICAQINGDEEVYLAVISGAGHFFCTGGDAPQLICPADDSGSAVRFTPAEAIGRIDRPTLAAINGDALGMGLEIALACDMRLSSKKARLGLPQIIEGQIPMDGGTQRLTRIVGKAKALELLLTGEIIDASAAYEIGLVNKIFPPASLMTEVAQGHGLASGSGVTAGG
jgi:enoyl-CoA hydratase/carnithine racemase